MCPLWSIQSGSHDVAIEVKRGGDITHGAHARKACMAMCLPAGPLARGLMMGSASPAWRYSSTRVRHSSGVPTTATASTSESGTARAAAVTIARVPLPLDGAGRVGKPALGEQAIVAGEEPRIERHRRAHLITRFRAARSHIARQQRDDLDVLRAAPSPVRSSRDRFGRPAGGLQGTPGQDDAVGDLPTGLQEGPKERRHEDGNLSTARGEPEIKASRFR